MENEKQLPKLGMENQTDFTVECSKIEGVTADHGMVSIKIKDGSIWKGQEKHVIKTFPDHVLIDELFRRHPNSSLILNKL